MGWCPVWVLWVGDIFLPACPFPNALPCSKEEGSSTVWGLARGILGDMELLRGSPIPIPWGRCDAWEAVQPCLSFPTPTLTSPPSPLNSSSLLFLVLFSVLRQPLVTPLSLLTFLPPPPPPLPPPTTNDIVRTALLTPDICDSLLGLLKTLSPMHLTLSDTLHRI